MNAHEKLRTIIPHWIEHNDEHAAELRRWVKDAGAAGADISAAADALAAATHALAAALQKLGGALPHSSRRQ